ncbi:hypothetical protein ZWY2020_026288 [Hordeum vulgare]|nr:hypothetical protein ZWY2020_026288 [Hordeum vulgare]
MLPPPLLHARSPASTSPPSFTHRLSPCRRSSTQPPVHSDSAMGPDWSSLPSELLGHIADCLLATNDVDCYMDFRAVCTSWRSAAEDPRSNPSDARFHPRR